MTKEKQTLKFATRQINKTKTLKMKRTRSEKGIMDIVPSANSAYYRTEIEDNSTAVHRN